MLSLEFEHPILGSSVLQGTPCELSEFLLSFTGKLVDNSQLQLNLSSNKTTISDPRTPIKKPTKRQSVLNTMKVLRNMGVFAPKTAQILEIYKQTYPDMDSSNIDQVLRDLANKTELVQRAEWGSFTLKEEAT